ncbi:MBL fold metallo-hydrolase [Thermosporothrix hazakensis]|nr:MBL fold metallo-hydrolase [Thermosporothrix hazakensis]BBH90715.1 hypothetical protein KTC_54660 [Thermosporothrix sp. COM3]
MLAKRGFVPVVGLIDDDRVRVFRSSFSKDGETENLFVYGFVLLTERYVVICDTLLGPEDMETELEQVREYLRGRRLLIINSHADWDHTWGNGYFRGTFLAPVIAHERCRERMLSAEAQEALREYQQQFACFHNVELVPPTLTFSDRMTINCDDMTLELFHAPGHQPDHIAVWIPEIRLLLAFDAVEDPFPSLADAESVPVMFATLERLQALQPAHMLCCHGEKNDPALITRNLAYFQELERRCQQVLAQQQVDEQTLEDAVRSVHFPYEEAIAGGSEQISHGYYNEAHTRNIRLMVQYLMGQKKQTD